MKSTPISRPLESSTARCNVFSSSRTLPGQRLVLSARRASTDSGRKGSPLAYEYLRMKCCASSPISAGRSRKGGICELHAQSCDPVLGDHDDRAVALELIGNGLSLQIFDDRSAVVDREVGE